MEKEREKERRREMAVCTCTCTHTRWSDVPMVLRKLGAHYCATCYIGRRVHGEQSKGLKLVWDDSDTIFFLRTIPCAIFLRAWADIDPTVQSGKKAIIIIIIIIIKCCYYIRFSNENMLLDIFNDVLFYWSLKNFLNLEIFMMKKDCSQWLAKIVCASTYIDICK